jgi:surface-adhesin protein E
MKRLLLIILLVLSSGPAYAEWVSLGESGSGTTVYVAPDTIRRKGDLVKMWVLYDFKSVQTVAGTSHLSSKVQDEFDCAEELSRTLALTEFSGNMGTGKVVFSHAGIREWQPVEPDSVEKVLWKVACGKE